MRADLMNRACGPDLADRLALTAMDRRLESMVLMEMMIRSSVHACDAEPAERETATQRTPRGGASPLHRSIYEHAVDIASYLSRAYGLQSLEHKTLLSELAVEIALRIDEEINGVQDPSPKSPRD